jgi:hypothetical protein
MEDEDLIMEETVEDEDDDERYESLRGKTVYPEDFGGSGSASGHSLPRFSRNPTDFSRVDLASGVNSPIHEWGDAMDEKGESVALMMHLEKSIVHQKFFNSKYLVMSTITSHFLLTESVDFDDDFDEDDLA